MAKLTFIGQPFDAQLGVFVRHALEDPATTRLWIATAWSKASGLTRIGDAIVAARAERGLYAEIVLGIDENGATVEGLQYAIDIFDDAYIFHDRGSRTFHPKIYGADGPSGATVIVGSGNLTKGGLYTNYEASTMVTTDREDDTDAIAYVQSVRAFYDRLHSETSACRRLDADLLVALQAVPSLAISSESARNRARAERRDDTAPTDRLFGGPVTGLLHAPAAAWNPIGTDRVEDTDDEGPRGAERAPVTQRREEVAADHSVADDDDSEALGFWKRLGPFDVSTSSAPGQILIPIRFLDFFPPMQDETAERASGGAAQFAVTFPLTFKDGSTVVKVAGARAILYVPAPDHPRPNREIRFTFHDRSVQSRLSAGDVLVFRKGSGGHVTVERRSGDEFDGRFARLGGV